MRLLLPGLLACCFLCACQQAPPPGAIPLEGRTWVLEEMQRGGAVSTPFADEQPPTIRFKPGGELTRGPEVVGFGGANQFFGSYQLGADGKLSILELGSTRTASPNPLVMDMERAYFMALQMAKAYEIADARLLIRTTTGSLHFVLAGK